MLNAPIIHQIFPTLCSTFVGKGPRGEEGRGWGGGADLCSLPVTLEQLLGLVAAWDWSAASPRL